MPPEQIKEKTPGKQADIWTFGVILYEMITSRLPFKSDDEPTLPYSILNEEPDYDQIPDGLTSLITKCLNKLPANRFQTFDEPGRIVKEFQNEYRSWIIRARKGWRTRF